MALFVAVTQAHSQPETRRTANLIRLLSHVLLFTKYNSCNLFYYNVRPGKVQTCAYACSLFLLSACAYYIDLSYIHCLVNQTPACVNVHALMDISPIPE
jgi:hypothetical protein